MKHAGIIAGEVIGREFFRRDPVVCALELLGCELVWEGCGGRIVETEAYSVVNDEACHTFSRRASREFVACSEPGTVYVYLNYGMYWLLNFLVKGGTEDGFVLVRALEPTVGVERMGERRGGVPERKLCAGPGLLGVALGLGRDSHGVDGCGKGPVRLTAPTAPVDVLSGPRIGINRSVDLPWRFVVAGSGCLSVPLRVRQA
jgi:DNA-3-methyladenine glycosylase